MSEKGFGVEVAEVKTFQQRELSISVNWIHVVDLVECRFIAETDNREVLQADQTSEHRKSYTADSSEIRESL